MALSLSEVIHGDFIYRKQDVRMGSALNARQKGPYFQQIHRDSGAVEARAL
jgi:hypothetical protein